MSIASALPMGATAGAELVTLHTAAEVDVKDVIARLNRSLPDGLLITSGRAIPENGKGPKVAGSEFIVSVSLPDGVSAADLEWAVVQLLALPSIMCERESGNKRKIIDLRPGIESVRSS